ncbi:MAG: PIN domain-containing protein [Acidobacteriota bacterium]
MARFPDAAVCDTHALGHYAFGSNRLGPTAAAMFDACDAGKAIIYVPAIVVVEFWFVFGARLSRSTTSLREFFDGLFANPAYQPFELTPEQVFRADEQRPNDDPFDRLICAAALRLELPLITRDTAICTWGGVRVVW